MKRILIMSSAIFLSFIWTQSAGMLAKPGENLIAIEGLYEKEDIEGGSITTTAIIAEYVLNGNIEFGIQYMMGEAQNDEDSSYDFDISGLTLGGYYHFLKNPNLPFNIKFGGTYGSAEANADWIDDAGVEINAVSTSFGGGIYKEIYTQGVTNITGFFNFNSITAETTLKMEGHEDETEKDDFNSTALGIVVRSNNFFVTPKIGRTDGESDFSVTFGILFQQ